ncbi:retrovirus-related pol polyprotein from transposon TNT 1-94 [Tanacetum coccineum]
MQICSLWFPKFADLLPNFTKVQAASPKRNLCRIHAPWHGARVQWKFQFPLHSCSLAGSTSAMEVSIPIAFVLPGREHECNESFKLGRPPALSKYCKSATLFLIVQICKTFKLLRMKDDELVKDYLARMMDVVNQMRLHGEVVKNQKVVEKMMISVPPKFEAKISAIEESCDLDTLTVSELTSKIQAQEQRVSIRLEEKAEGAFRVSSRSNKAGSFEVVGQEEKAYRLYKALYGLKQAPKACNLIQERLIISLYVDDLLVIGSNDHLVKEFKKQMEFEFDMSDMGLVSYFLGVEIKRLPNGVHISQRKYASDMLKKFKMFLCKPVTSPLVYKCKLSKDDDKKLVNPTRVRSIVASLLYLTISRPDLGGVSFLLNFLNRKTS